MVFFTLWDLLYRRYIFFGILALIIFPFLTYYITTLLFYRRARSLAKNKVPPTIPYFAPGLFHAFSLASFGPQKYLAELIKSFGDFGPFFVNAGPQSFLIVHNPEHVRKILDSPKAVTQNASRVEVFDKILGSPQYAVDFYTSKVGSETHKQALKRAHVDLIREHLTGDSLSKNVETYASILSDNLNDKMFQVGSWTQIEDSWSFLQQVMTRCILASLFGTDIFKQYPGVVKDYWEFANTVEGFVPGMPRYWVPGAVSAVRSRLLSGIEKWLRANHSGSEFARITDEDPIWDSLRGSKFIQERDDVLTKIECMYAPARAAEMLGIMHESCSNLIPCTFWTLLEVVHKPALVISLTASIDRLCPSQDAVHHITAIAELPLVQSLQAEIKRLHTATVEVYHSGIENFALDKDWTVSKGIPMVLFSRDIAMNTESWLSTQPRNVQRPLEEFWAERFLQPNKSERKPGKRDGIYEPPVLLLENGSHPSLGKDYMDAIQTATLAVLLNEFEIQPCEPERFDAVIPPLHEIAFGMLKPLENVAVRIRKRPMNIKR